MGNALKSRWLGGQLVLYPSSIRGDEWHVDSVNGLDTNTGKDWDHPLATALAAVTKATAGRGDVIWLAPYHTEDLVDATTLACAKAGITIVGLGIGNAIATLSPGTDAAATVAVTAADFHIKNVKIISALADVAAGITASAAADGLVVEECWLTDGGTDVLELVIGVSVAANCDNVRIINNRFQTVSGGGCASAVKFVGASADSEVSGNRAFGDYSASCIDGATAAGTSMIIADNTLNNIDAAAGQCINLNAATTGDVVRNMCHGALDGTSPITAAACHVNGNYGTNTEGSSGVLLPVAEDSAANFVGLDNNNNDVATTNVVANEDGSVLERQEYAQVQLGVGELTGDADMDISEAVYTSFVNLMTITAPATGLAACRLDLDFNKATTGWDTIATAADTLDVELLVQPDGTNYRSMQMPSDQITANGGGSLDATESGKSWLLGPMAPNASIQVHVKLSAERDDCEIPYRVTYHGAAPTVTPVAAA